MKNEQIKSLLINILTVAVPVGVLIVGYFIFVKKDTATVSSVASIAKIAEETVSIGTQIDYTVKDLGDLERAVADSKIIFDLPAFKNLQDFTVAVPIEAVGRSNPFIPTAWKLKMRAIEETAAKSATSQSGAQSASVSGVQSQTP
ncbi:MAG: hypothetical protein HZB11_00475 [Candidatus Yonathbacteria bacterium]|nr:hypothetical protein [Candidatus Yonathbacteria bacterium]